MFYILANKKWYLNQVFFITLKWFWSVNIKNEITFFIWKFEIMNNEKAESQIDNLISNH
jgi:hypothetical protein